MNHGVGGTLCGIAVVTSMAAVARGGTLVLEPSKDNTLFSTGNTSNGAGEAMFCGQTGTGVKQRCVLAFDIAGSVPAGSTITAVSLTLIFIQQGPNSGPQPHALRKLLADWGEGASDSGGGGGAPAQPGDATWFHRFFPDAFWAGAGGDFSAVDSASQTVANVPGPVIWASSPQMIADVQGWLDDPGIAFGWLLQGNEVDLSSAKKFGSKDALDPAMRPRLELTFNPPPCPWDCGDADGTVGILDFLALLSAWGQAGGACDLGIGQPGVGIEEFQELLGHWGDCA